MSTTPAANFATIFASVVDTGGKFAPGINNTGGKFATEVNLGKNVFLGELYFPKVSKLNN